MANIVPEKIINFKVYLDGGDLLGVAEGNFPTGEFETVEIKGAGVAGTVNAPTIGHTGSITVSLTWRTVTESFSKLLTPDGHTLDMYADLEGFDAGKGLVVRKELYIYMKARTTKFELGKLVSNDSMDTNTEHEVYYYKTFLNGKELVEVDKYNYIYKVNGVDYLAETRRHLGML